MSLPSAPTPAVDKVKDLAKSKPGLNFTCPTSDSPDDDNNQTEVRYSCYTLNSLNHVTLISTNP